MVRNTNGGGNAKRQARKHQNTKRQTELVKSTCDLELYAFVTKMSGGNLCRVYTQNGEELCCHISGKFRNRNLRHNLLSVGVWVLVGLREWEKKIENCDLLYVYDKDDIEQLRNLPNVNLRKLLSAMNQMDNVNGSSTDVNNYEDDDEFVGFEFSSSATVSSSEINKIIAGNVEHKVETYTETIDIEDI